MTEQDAMDKWCPHSAKYHSNGSYNRSDTAITPSGTHCIGSRCMAWRWIQDELIAFVANGKTVVTDGTHGYCGLSGPL